MRYMRSAATAYFGAQIVSSSEISGMVFRQWQTTRLYRSI